MAAPKGHKKAGGRKKGTPNFVKQAKPLREMILTALSEAGGVEYLKEQAVKHPGSFLTLIGKVLPMQVTGENGGPVKGEWVVTVKKAAK